MKLPSLWLSTAALFVLAGCASATTGRGSDAGSDAASSPDVPLVHPTPAPDVLVADATADAPAPDASTSCEMPAPESLSIGLVLPGGAHDDCAAPGTPGTSTVTARRGAVLSVRDTDDGTELTLDLCSPAADCLTQPATLTVNAPRFSLGSGPLALRVGQFVQLRTRSTRNFGCTMQFELSNIPSWDGAPNPVRHDDALLAAGSNGEAEALPDGPFGVTPQSIGCPLAGPSCGPSPELFALSVQGSCRTCLRAPDPALVPMGSERGFINEAQTYTFRNLRSYQSGACDDNDNFAWTVRELWLE